MSEKVQPLRPDRVYVYSIVGASGLEHKVFYNVENAIQLLKRDPREKPPIDARYFDRCKVWASGAQMLREEIIQDHGNA